MRLNIGRSPISVGLAEAKDRSRGSGRDVGNYNIYRRSDDECGGLSYEALTTVQPEPAGHSGEENTVELQGLSADGTNTFFAADYGRLTVDAPNIGHVAQVYEKLWRQLSFVCVLPDAKPALRECALGHMNQSWGLPPPVFGGGSQRGLQ